MNLNKIHRHQHTTHNKTEWETAHKHIHIININSEALGSSFFTPFSLCVCVSLVLSLWILCCFIEMLKWLRDAQWPTNVIALTLRFLYWNHTLLKAAEVYFHSEKFFLMCCCCTFFLSCTLCTISMLPLLLLLLVLQSLLLLSKKFTENRRTPISTRIENAVYTNVENIEQ